MGPMMKGIMSCPRLYPGMPEVFSRRETKRPPQTPQSHPGYHTFALDSQSLTVQQVLTTNSATYLKFTFQFRIYVLSKPARRSQLKNCKTLFYVTFMFQVMLMRFAFSIQCSLIFSSPQLKAQVDFSDPLLTICLSVPISHFHFLSKNNWASFN